MTASLLACALAATAVAVLVSRAGLPALQPGERGVALGTLLVAAVLLVGAFRLWWTSPFAGLPNTRQGVDAGNHVLLYLRFIAGDAHPYEGFVGLYHVCLSSIPIALDAPMKQQLARLRERRVGCIGYVPA